MHLNKHIFIPGSILFILLSSFFSCSKPKEPKPSGNLPQLKIEDASQVRLEQESTMTFYLDLNTKSSKVVSVDYSLRKGTAQSPKDFEAASGTITIPPNQTQATLNVKIKGNAKDLREPNKQFTVLLSNPKNCKLIKKTATGTIVTENGTYLPTDSTGYSTPLNYSGYSLVWHDEFSGKNLNRSDWNYETGNNNGWGNQELEYYTSSTKNVFVSSGNLIIEARKEKVSSFNYTSGRITTQNKKQFQYGRIDIRAKLPVGQGIWPALWMLGANFSSVGWPACGEIDITELVGKEPHTVYGTMHWKSASGASMYKGNKYTLSSEDFSQKFHVFSLVWTKDTIKWYVDNHLFVTNTKADVGSDPYPFNAPEFFLFNVAVGGVWPGSPNDKTHFPQRMFVDYIRVFQMTK